MNTQQPPTSKGNTVIVRRVVTASAVRRLRSDIARNKKTKKVLRRMKKEADE